MVQGLYEPISIADGLKYLGSTIESYWGSTPTLDAGFYTGDGLLRSRLCFSGEHTLKLCLRPAAEITGVADAIKGNEGILHYTLRHAP